MNIKDFYNKTFSYYEYYLKQRTESFNFFLVIAGLLVSATAVVLTQIERAPIPLLTIVILLSVALIIISFLFSRLDNRTKQFLKKTESILISYENKVDFDGEKLFIATEALRQNDDKKFTMGLAFKCVFIIFAVLGLFELVAAVILALYFC